MYAWCLYDVHIRGADAPEPDVLNAAQTIVRLVAFDEQAYDPAKIPFVATVLRVANACDVRQRDREALKWLDKLDPMRLPTNAFRGHDSKGREQEMASPREKYYSIRTRALERLGLWQECLNTAGHALGNCGPFHHDNDIWFARRIAISKVRLGQAAEALPELEQLAARKPTGFIHTDIATAAWQIGDTERTFKHALLAALAPQKIGFKLHPVQLLAEILWRRGDVELARTHLQLCIAGRVSNGWKVQEDLKILSNTWDVKEPIGDVQGLLKQLEPLWRTWSGELNPRQTGMIQKILPHGRAGFIRSEGNQQFYFNTRDWQDRRSKPTEGIRVTFLTRTGFDPKRQLPSTVACDVRVFS
jgi:hypothetical protein